MPLADEIKTAIDRAVSEALSKVELRAGTVILSPTYAQGDPITVVLDGSSVAVEVTMVRAFNVFPNARVVVARVGADYTVLGTFLDVTQAHIVAGIPGGGRMEFDPYTIRFRVYDSTGSLVIEMDDSEGISVYDPQGDVGNRTRLMNEFGQLVLSQLPGTGYGFTRWVTYKEDEGLATERVRAAMEGCVLPGQLSGQHAPDIELFSQRDDASLGPRLTLSAHQDATDTPQSRIQLFAGLIDLQPWASDAAREVRVTNAPFTVNGDQVCGSEEGINGRAVTSGSDTTTSLTHVNMAGTGAVTSFTFVKRYTATRVRLDGAASVYVGGGGATTNVVVAARINATDYDLWETPCLVNERQFGTGFRYVTGIPAGTYTVQMRWRRTAATGTLTRDTADWLSASARECD